MNFEGFFRDFWWLMFPIFGMFMAVWGLAQSDRRTRNMIDLIRSYTDQGKEPPPELMRLATQSLDEFGVHSPKTEGRSSAWSFIVFTALAAGFGVGYWMVRGEGFAFAFLLVAVVMGVMAVGALLLLVLRRK